MEKYLLFERKLHTDQPIWSPKIGNDCHVTIWPEQGMGDFILFCRFINDLFLKMKISL